MKKIIKETIVVEGKYDKIRLESLVEANILQTDGFQIFKNKEMVSLLGRLADETGLIILTDSDRAGFIIRHYIKNCLAGKNVKQAFIPSIEGKEKRKETAGKEGLLGVEGMRDEALLSALSMANCQVECQNLEKITKSDLFILGLTGKTDSKQKREDLMVKLKLPKRLSTNELLSVLNALYTKEKFFELF